MPESADEQGVMLAFSTVAAQARLGETRLQTRCATMERCVPKDCTNRRTTLPKRLGKNSRKFLIRYIQLKNMEIHKIQRNHPYEDKKVGMRIALALSALLT